MVTTISTSTGKRGDVKAVESLIKRGSDIEQAIKLAGSLQKLASNNERSKMIEFLKAKGIS
jgi:hypothetical protein